MRWRRTGCRSASSSLRISPATAWICTESGGFRSCCGSCAGFPSTGCGSTISTQTISPTSSLTPSPGRQRSATIWISLSSTATTPFSRPCAAGRPRPGWRSCSAGCGSASPAWCCGPASSRDCPMRTRRPSRSCATFWASRSSSGWGPSPTLRRRELRRPEC